MRDLTRRVDHLEAALKPQEEQPEITVTWGVIGDPDPPAPPCPPGTQHIVVPWELPPSLEEALHPQKPAGDRR